MKKTMKLCALLTVFFMVASYSSNAQCSGGGATSYCHSADAGLVGDIFLMSCPTGHISYYIELSTGTNGTASANIWGDGPNVQDAIVANDYEFLSDNLTGFSSSLWIEIQATASNGTAHASVTTW